MVNPKYFKGYVMRYMIYVDGKHTNAFYLSKAEAEKDAKRLGGIVVGITSSMGSILVHANGYIIGEIPLIHFFFRSLSESVEVIVKEYLASIDD